MTISLVINTCAGAPHAKHVQSSGKVPYSWRAYALQNFILPRYLADPHIDEVVVAGQWKPAPHNEYVYVPVAPEHFNWADCIAQRHAGCEAASGDQIIVQHDDHMLDAAWAAVFAAIPPSDVVSVARRTRARVVGGEPLNDGHADDYIDGHCAIYAREVLEACPWSNVPVTFALDIAHTKQIVDAGFTITYSPQLIAWDVEYGATPWM